MMSENDKANYHNIIREMIKSENKLRSSRNNWFVAIQSFLFTAVCHICLDDSFSTCCSSCNDMKKCLLAIAVLIGIITSISFLFAAWRSAKAIAMAMSAWDKFLEENKNVIEDYPPVCLITDSIISKTVPSMDNIGIENWVKCMNKQMYPEGKECKKCRDKLINKFEWLMPFKFIPLFFIVIWVILFIALV